MAAGHGFDRVEREAAQTFGAAAARAGVRRIVYLGGLIPPNPRSRHLRSREETGRVLRGSGVPVTELRAGMIIGPGSAAYEVIRDLVNHLPVMTTPSWVRSRSTPIALDDLLDYLVAVGGLESAAGRILEAGGAEAVTYEQVMRCYAGLVGKQPRIIAVPVLTPRLSSYWLRLVTSVPTGIARALVEGLEHDFLADDAELRRLVPLQLKGLEESIRAAIEADRAHTVVARWVEGAIACRNFRPEYAFYAMRAGGKASAPVSRPRPSSTRCAGSATTRNAGTTRTSLWDLRRDIDWLLGGPSLRRKRRHPTELRVGDVVDSWRVIAIEPGRRLTLLMEMKAPGAGVLEFVVEPASVEGATSVSATAYWHPAGVWGLLYWYTLVPAHLFLFAGLTRAIVARAAGLDAAGPGDAGGAHSGSWIPRGPNR